MPAPLSIGFDVPFEEAIAWGRDRISTFPEVYYRVLPAQARSRAFTVSGLAALDQIQGVLDSLNKTLETGGTFADWKRTLKPEVLALGRDRLDTIFRTAIQTHYNIGQYQQQEANKAHRPYRMWDAINDGRTRPAHRAMDGFVAPIDDPIWRRWSAPAGYRCRCRTITLTEAQAVDRGYKPGQVPPNAEPDKGWDYDKLTGQDAALARVVSQRLAQCNVFDFAGKRTAKPVWCQEGKARDFALMHQAWAERGGQMPAPRPLVLPPLPFVSAEKSFDQFMRALGADGDTLRVTLPSSDIVLVSDDLFRALDGRWKIDKRGRDQWLLYLAELIKAPQEIWRLRLGQSEELYLLGRFQRGKQRIDAMAVFKREGDEGVWSEGKTAFVADREDYIGDKRADLIEKSAIVRWLEM